MGKLVVDMLSLVALSFTSMTNKHLVSPRLRRLRRERELSLDVVAIQTGIDRADLSRKERRLAPVSEAELLKLAAFFGIDPNELRDQESRQP